MVLTCDGTWTAECEGFDAALLLRKESFSIRVASLEIVRKLVDTLEYVVVLKD